MNRKLITQIHTISFYRFHQMPFLPLDVQFWQIIFMKFEDFTLFAKPCHRQTTKNNKINHRLRISSFFILNLFSKISKNPFFLFKRLRCSLKLKDSEKKNELQKKTWKEEGERAPRRRVFMSTDDDQGYKNEHSSFIEQLSSNRFGNYSLSSSCTVQ